MTTRVNSRNNHSWPFYDQTDNDDGLSVTKRMVRQLAARIAPPGQPEFPLDRRIVALGLKVYERREENGWTIAELAQRTRPHLDQSFLRILESGRASPEELAAPQVLQALARGLGRGVSVADLEQTLGYAVDVQPKKDHLGNLWETFLTWGGQLEPAMGSARTLAPDPATVEEIQSALIDDYQAELSYQVGLDPIQNRPILTFYQFQDPEKPLSGWEVTFLIGVRDVIQGVTNESGQFSLPLDLEEIPSHAYLRISRTAAEEKDP